MKRLNLTSIQATLLCTLFVSALSGCNLSDPLVNQRSDEGMTGQRSAEMGMLPPGKDLGDMARGVVGGGEEMSASCAEMSDAQLCQLRDAQCGVAELVDECQQPRQVDCGPCPTPSSCDDSTNLCSCVPQGDEDLCKTLGYTCGSITLFDNCGSLRELVCGSCDPNEGACENNRCDGCVPESAQEFCARQSATCGVLTAPDNCGVSREVACGPCPSPDVCNGDNVCECKPESTELLCAKNNKECGVFTADDQCGRATDVDCGPCAAGTCEDNKCTICTPESDTAFCARQGVQCGMAQGMDNCGAMRAVNECGPCAGAETCSSNAECVCPTPRCDPNQCGTVSNACGATRDCGGCAAAGEVCTNNACVCPVVTCGQNACGTVTNACGQSTSCGTCSGFDSCINNVCVCQPESDTELCEFRECGNVSVIDRCGNSRTINCGGSCPAGEICRPSGFCCPKNEFCIEP